MALYNEQREGQTPRVSGSGDNMIVNWEHQPSGFSQSSSMLASILSTLEQEETKKRKKESEKFDFYKTLREAGYDTKAAFDAMNSGKIPSTAPSSTTKERKEQADLEKTEADTRLSTSKADAYDRGDMGKKQSAADKMNAAQLQREIKRISDPFENPDYDSEETKSYSAYLNQRLQQISQYPGAEASPAASAIVQQAKPAAQSGKIKVRRKSDGAMGSVSAKFFDPKKYDKVA